MNARFEVVSMLEEHSMKVFLMVPPPRCFPALVFHPTTHPEKKELDKSLPRKPRVQHDTATCLVTVRHQDAGDCTAVTQRLLKLARDAGNEDMIVRIARRQLESWLLGDLQAIATAYDRPTPKNVSNTQQYRNPDTPSSLDTAVKHLLGGYRYPSTRARSRRQHFRRERRNV